MKPEGSSEVIFASLTPKQREVMELIADNRTTKEIGHYLGVSDSAVNQRINALRAKFGNVPRSELARIFRSCADPAGPAHAAQGSSAPQHPACQQMTGEKLQLQPEQHSQQSGSQDDPAGVFSLADAVHFRIDAPWQEKSEVRVVPRMLDGSNSLLVRSALIAVATAALLLCMVAVVGLAQGLTAILGR